MLSCNDLHDCKNLHQYQDSRRKIEVLLLVKRHTVSHGLVPYAHADHLHAVM